MQNMILTSAPGLSVHRGRGSDYRTVPLRDLIDRVCVDRDLRALSEIHERPLFQFNGSGRVRMAEFVGNLRAEAARRNDVVAERAYDITIDRFSQLPEDGIHGASAGGARPMGTDCRRYFGALLRVMRSWKGRHLASASIADEEHLVATLLQRLVMKHFRLALMEARRSALMTRYVWVLPNGRISVLMPRSMVGSERRKWLERNVPDCDPARAGEKQRVQGIVDDKIGQYHSISVPDDSPGTLCNSGSVRACMPWGMMIPCAADGLAETVASEKAATLDEQRPGIQRLGADSVHLLVRRIFSDLADGTYRLVDVAQTFGVAKATLSRFAAGQWHLNGDEGKGIPDLWANTARVIGQNPDFIDVAEEFGVWPRIKAVLSVVRLSE